MPTCAEGSDKSAPSPSSVHRYVTRMGVADSLPSAVSTYWTFCALSRNPLASDGMREETRRPHKMPLLAGELNGRGRSVGVGSTESRNVGFPPVPLLLEIPSGFPH